MRPDDDAPRHGGALMAAAARYGIPVADWLDLSTGINPEPYPAPAIESALLARLPDPSDLAALVAAARRSYQVPADAAVVPMPGSDVALRLIPLLRRPGRVAIVGPTYSGHAEGWRAAGHAVEPVASLDAAAGSSAVVLVNPNNPDGRLVGVGAILAALDRLPPDGLLLVDEAFADLAPAQSLASNGADERLVILRSFGKFYGLAGLRLGFAFGRAALLDRLAALVGDWPVSGPAVAIGRVALADDDWQAAARTRLAAMRRSLDALLAQHRLLVDGGTDLFRLVRAPDAQPLHEALAAQGIWTRVFAELPEAIRFGSPTPAGLARLGRALAGLRRPGRS